MVRTQIQLTERQASLLKRISSDRDISMAEIIRVEIDHFLANSLTMSRDEKVRNALEVSGKYHSGQGDGSIRHDDYLDEAFQP